MQIRPTDSQVGVEVSGVGFYACDQRCRIGATAAGEQF